MEKMKRLVMEECARIILTKKEMLLGEIRQIEESLSTATKSTAGDKHETGRAHMHAEQNKLQKMLSALNDMESALRKLPAGSGDVVSNGSLVRSTMGYFFFGPAIGSLQAGDQKVQALSLDSPLGQLMLGRRVGETIVLNGNEFRILEHA